MQTQLTLSGVPRGLAKDGWWLSESAEATGGVDAARPDPSRLRTWRAPGVGLIFLVLLADVLLYDQHFGLSLALFAVAIFGVATLDIAPRRLLRPAAVLAFAVLPVLEYLQFLSVLFLCVGTLAALVMARRIAVWPGALKLAARLPFGGLVALFRGLIRASERSEPIEGAPIFEALKQALRNWAFPLGGFLVLFALLIEANPVLEGLLAFDLELDLSDLIPRAVFWSGMALLLWPLLERRTPDAPVSDRATQTFSTAVFGINAASVLRALVMFNLLIGLQTVLDLSILIGGADLPEGMSYATYAHRGAYPLLMTALLAGAFSLAARPHLASHPLLKPLLLLWLVQNIALTGSAALRLDLYIEVYGLTYLRVHALIWMALVAAGLALAIWQVARGRSNGWVIRRTSALSFATLYVCCFINFASVIVAHNIQSEAEFDLYYARALGPTAAIALSDVPGATMQENGVMIAKAVFVYAPRIRGWRDWGFRNWRVRHYLATNALVELGP